MRSVPNDIDFYGFVAAFPLSLLLGAAPDGILHAAEDMEFIGFVAIAGI